MKSFSAPYAKTVKANAFYYQPKLAALNLSSCEEIDMTDDADIGGATEGIGYKTGIDTRTIKLFLPKLRKLGEHALTGTCITEIDVGEDNAVFKNDRFKTMLISKDTNELVWCATCNSANDSFKSPIVEIPEYVTSIKKNALKGIEGSTPNVDNYITDVIGNNISAIGGSAFKVKVH